MTVPCFALSLLWRKIIIFPTFLILYVAGGPIWCLSRPLIGKQVADKCSTVLSLVLEFGALYLAGAIAFVVVAQSLGTHFVSHFFSRESRDNILIVDIQTTAGAIFGQLVVELHVTVPNRTNSHHRPCRIGKRCRECRQFVAAQIHADQSPLDFRTAAASRDSNGLAMASSPAASTDSDRKAELQRPYGFLVPQHWPREISHSPIISRVDDIMNELRLSVEDKQRPA
ncbi:hypothetical protein B0H13DRAFT_1867467 [Mycena leptocephala]|nr:hypothetical protein B0H13DRAFT_1867467 [Mycena leptocephala]